MNTPSMIVGPSIILLQPLVGRFHVSDLNFRPTFWQCLAIKWYLRDEGLLLQCLIGIVYVFKRVMNTPNMIVGPSIILLQPLVGRFHASDLDVESTFRQRLAIKWYPRDVGLLPECLFGIVYVFKRVMITPNMIVGPSIILLQPLVGRFHASDFLISAHFL